MARTIQSPSQEPNCREERRACLHKASQLIQ